MDQGFARLQRAQEEDHSESPYLDFKESKSKNGELSREERAAQGQALSAFANTYGGVLIWGVEAKNNQPNQLRPIPNIAKFERTIQDQLGQALAPPLSIDVHRIDDPSNLGSGYVVIFVPSANPKPYMSLIDHRYYIRSGSNSIKAEHPIVRSLFLATAVPNARLEIIDASASHNSVAAVIYDDGSVQSYGDHVRIDARIILQNTGGVPIHGCAIAVPARQNYTIGGINDLYHDRVQILHATLGEESTTRVEARLFIMREHVVVYPGTALVVGSFQMTLDSNFYDETPISVPYAIFTDTITLLGTMKTVAAACQRT